MKKLLILVFLLLLVYQFAFAGPKEIAKDIITAYQTSDADLLKKHASGMLLPAITRKFFDDSNVVEIKSLVKDWDSEIKEVRYNGEKMMDKTIYISLVHFADCVSAEELCVVMLSSLDKKDWKAFGLGISTITKDEFYSYSTQIQDVKITEPKKSKRSYTVETASGEIVEDPSLTKLLDMIKSLDDDNFFITLSHPDGFLQAAYSEDGFYAEYSGVNGYFGADKALTLKETLELFSNYYNNIENWKGNISWEEM